MRSSCVEFSELRCNIPQPADKSDGCCTPNVQPHPERPTRRSICSKHAGKEGISGHDSNGFRNTGWPEGGALLYAFILPIHFLLMSLYRNLL